MNRENREERVNRENRALPGVNLAYVPCAVHHGTVCRIGSIHTRVLPHVVLSFFFRYQRFLEIITNIGLYIPSSSFFFRYVVVSGYDLYPKSADSAYNTPSEYRTKLLKQIRKTQSVLGFGNTGTKDCKVIFYCTRLCVFLSTFTNKCLPVRVSGTCYIWYMLFVICSSFYVQTAHACSSSTLPCFPLLV